MAEYDLTHQHAKYLDIHLTIPLMQFLVENETYDKDDLQLQRFTMLEKTNMVDFAMEVYRDLNPEGTGQSLLDRREEVVAEMKKMKMESTPILAIFEEEDVQQQVTSSRDHKSLITYLEENYQFKPEMIDTIYKYAKFQFECGNYSATADYMFLFRNLVDPKDKNYLNAMWGKLAAEILAQEWDSALEDLNRLKEILDGNVLTTSPLQSLQARTWLIHWSLFVFFNHPKGRELIVEMFLYQNQYLNAIQTICPHILRYLAAAVVINKQRRQPALRDIVKVIQQETYTYSDPITEFLASLYVDFDFDQAQEKLRLCSDVLQSDFFLVALHNEFIDNARLMIFEVFCRIHQCIRIDMLAEKLDMSYEQAELWIVDLIRQAKLDAKIDSQLGHVIMGTQAVSPYQQIIDKTNNLSFRTQMIATNIEKKLNTRSSDSYKPYY